ncbi:hypothetical protein [Brevibacillus reuszeri]|uniref:hypothetical protein n=1 Tax=Brevibacillus reuszeri TaxID=54915 RepID=UPI000CCBDB47|nr:hypothetical protein [Brevibacillus reuszeri]
MASASKFVLIYEPALLLIAMPDESAEISYQDFKVCSPDNDQDLRFCYFELLHGATIPSHVMDKIGDRYIRQVKWEGFCKSRSLASTIAECLLRIGVRVSLARKLAKIS